MRILFLDIDGVLNFVEHRNRFGMEALSLDCLKPLVWILVETEAKVVITSSWRIHHSSLESMKGELANSLEESGLDEFSRNLILGRIIDMTLDFAWIERCREIREWLDNQDGVEAFAILDDDRDIFQDDSGVFWTSDESVGLTWEIAERAIKHLKGGNH